MRLLRRPPAKLRGTWVLYVLSGAMTLTLFALATLAVIWFAWIGKCQISGAVLGVTLALGLAIGCGPVAGGLLKGLEPGYPAWPGGGWGKRSAIVLLGGGTEKVADTGAIETSPLVYGRLAKALELYLQCKRDGGECFILASGGDPEGSGASEASVYREQLAKLGVKPADIVLEGRSRTTWQNAQLSSELLKSRPPEHVFLVTSGIHLRRSVLYFGYFGVKASPVRADYVNAVMSPVPLAYNFMLTDLALHEYAGILRYYIYRTFGWK
jgi:uncharacterized SAM-binding protein YcdF (DUF218 family)